MRGRERVSRGVARERLIAPSPAERHKLLTAPQLSISRYHNIN